MMRTLVNSARSTMVSLCAHTNSPTNTVSGSDTPVSVWVASVSPKGAVDMRNMPSRRSSWISTSPLERRPLACCSSVVAPAVRRNWSDARPSPCSAAVTCAPLLSSEGRIVQPSFRCGSTPAPSKRARADRMKLPVTRFHTKWKSSCSPHMFCPEPAIRYAWRCASYDADPGRRTRPMSVCASKTPTVF